MNRSNFAVALLNWYEQYRRDLPWRTNPDPYAIWVSEVMLQQTRVETVIPYYQRWMDRFPTIAELAKATQQEVLTAWEGLGYYHRARNLHRSAIIIMEEMNGELPSDPRALCKLPGVGRYTAGAIASIAFGLDEPALDSNIRRVLARYFNVTVPIQLSNAENLLWKLAAENLPSGLASQYNQALMDLGAILCTPHNPDCMSCPLNPSCQARAMEVQEERPVSQAKPAIPHYIVTAAVITHNCHVLIAQRPPNGLLGGLWEFPGGKLLSGEGLVDCLKREIREELGVLVNVVDRLGVYKHAYTHFRVTLHAFRCILANGDLPQAIQATECSSQSNDIRWVNPEELHDYPMGKIDRIISRDLLLLEGIC